MLLETVENLQSKIKHAYALIADGDDVVAARAAIRPARGIVRPRRTTASNGVRPMTALTRFVVASLMRRTGLRGAA